MTFVIVVILCGVFIIEDCVYGQGRRMKAAIEDAQRISEVSSFTVIKEVHNGVFVLRNDATGVNILFTACIPEQLTLTKHLETGKISFEMKEYDELNSLFIASPGRAECYLKLKR